MASERKLCNVNTAHNQCHAKVYWSAELSEYRVKFYLHATYMEDGDYFTSQKEDAIQTAQLQCNRGWQAQG